MERDEWTKVHSQQGYIAKSICTGAYIVTKEMTVK
jgi:hypothetical protein